jgi:hypothetical protein
MILESRDENLKQRYPKQNIKQHKTWDYGIKKKRNLKAFGGAFLRYFYFFKAR